MKPYAKLATSTKQSKVGTAFKAYPDVERSSSKLPVVKMRDLHWAWVEFCTNKSYIVAFPLLDFCYVVSRMIVTSKYNIKILASNNSFESMQVKGDQKFSSLKQKPQEIAAGH